ncbi:MAG: hypothetical protein PHQ34_09275 [Methanothrix sp.]|nr:hypothetical protein [Methanothrix sp.]
MVGVKVEDEVRALPELLLHGGRAGALVVGGRVVDVARHHGPHIIDKLTLREE